VMKVAPMIDVLLVLLIIFMAIVPTVLRGEADWLRIPHCKLPQVTTL